MIGSRPGGVKQGNAGGFGLVLWGPAWGALSFVEKKDPDGTELWDLSPRRRTGPI